ncbi:MAG: family 20 glycosylhydrolase, partial [Lentisphaerae bacterium]|nr:family 20 glycosylhydrolase [Lentisphaerota bacterium]
MGKAEENDNVYQFEGRQPDWIPFPWRGQMVTMRQGPTDPEVFAQAIEKMIAADLNLLVVEVEKGLRYDSHPKVSADWALSKDSVRDLLLIARRGGVQCVPLLPSLSHSGYLVEAYPQIAEKHCVCPRHAFTHKVLDDLADELIELFEPTLFHIGHDEMLTAFPRHQRISALQCPVCRGDNAAEWYRDSILRRHERLTARGLGVMMWADMLLEPEEFQQKSQWQGNMHAFHGGWPDHFERALDDLPRDIIMCDWH